MKRYIVDQTGEMRSDVERRFVVEVPDNLTEKQVEELLEEAGESLKDWDGMEWIDDNDQGWTGADVEVSTTDVCDLESFMDGEETAAHLPVITLEDIPCRRRQ